VWLSILVSSSGDGMFLTAFPLLAALLTKDPVLVAGVTISTRLPWLLFSLPTGAIADRMNRRRLMIGADMVRLVIVGLLGASILFDVVNIWMLYVSAFALGICETLHVNAAQALLPSLVEERHLLTANARFSTAQIVSTQFIGPPVGVALFTAGHALPFLVDSATFGLSAALVARIPHRPVAEKPTSRFRDDIVEGMRFMLDSKALRRLTEIVAVINFFYFAAASLFVLYVEELLDSGEIVFTALSVGAAIGTVTSRFFVDGTTRRFGYTRTITFAMWLWGAATVGLAFGVHPVLAISANFVLGFGTGLWIAVNSTLRQQFTPDRLLGRMNAAFRMISWGVVPFGALFGGVLARLFDVRAPFIAAAVATMTAAIFASRLLRPVEELLADKTLR
jgi:MFS family permease